ncbi:MAG: TonB-dependent receptor [Gammaproteobacteria bacterium]|nr:TonB-dependent receptor [Gammaproteobacteria bacterium]
MKLNKLMNGLILAGLACNAYAAEEQDEPIERIEVTGSSIKRTSIEGDLPLTIVSKAEIDAAGITSAEQLMLQLNISSNSSDNLASNASIVGGEDRGNNGASSANLRGQGVSSTLVLLNGRRVATHGFKGRSVDLNSIPFSALERVEILRDGASAVYGTDAIGGVINFILKKNYEGVQVSGFTDLTEEGGGNIHKVSLLAGTGDIDADGWNVMATVTAKKAEILRGNERDFTNTFQPDRGLSPDTRGTPYASLNDRFSSPNDPASSHYNLIGAGVINPETGLENSNPNVLALPGQPGCDAFENTDVDTGELWNRSRETRSCAWDYPRAAVLQQPVDTLNLVSRGTMKLGEDHEAFVEVVAARVQSDKVFEPNQITPWAIGAGDWDTHGGGFYPASGEDYQYVVDALSSYYGADQLNIGAPIAYRWRCMDCGPREISTTSKSYKIQFGMEGLIGDWDYKFGISRSGNEAESELGSGYHYTEQLAEAIGTGLVSPFRLPGQSQSAAGMAALDAASAEGVVLFGGETTLTQIDGSISGDTGFELGLGGDSIWIAAGFDLRTEEYGFNGDAEAETRPDIYGAPFDNANALDPVSRDVNAVFVEAIVPVVEELELNLAVRYDDYDGFGGTTNPKFGFKYSPIEELLVRGAYSTGFRVPTFNQLFNAAIEEPYTGTDLADPAFCEDGIVQDGNDACQPITPVMIYGGKVDLGPEETNQSSFGLVLAPTDNISFNVDWWEINTEGSIQTPSMTDLLESYDLFQANFLRSSDGTLLAIDRRYINAGERVTSGIEVGAKADFDVYGGQLAINFNGSHMIEDKKKLLDTDDFSDNLVGTHSRGNIPLEWKHSISVGYITGDWSHLLTNVYRSGYEDEVPAGIESLENPDDRDFALDWEEDVESYSVFHYSVSYTGIENMTLRAGVKNLFNTEPPFTAHQNDYSPGAGFDPRVADPRMRSYTLQVDYNF